MKTPEQIAEEAAQRLVTEHDIEHVDGETAIQALAWDLGEGQLTYEAGLAALVTKAIEIDRAQRDEPAQHTWFTCVDCNSGDMTEDAARWHESHEGHVVKELDDEEEQD